MILLLALVGPVRAEVFSAPFGDEDYGYFYPTAYYDHGGVDWACGSIRYSGHQGSDFGCGSWSGMDAGRDIVAAADGTVIYTNDGEYDRCSTGDCDGGSGCGNYVKIQHDDGTMALYCHMKEWSVAVSYGQRVSCGDKLGEVGSSGHSTGPHLHFEPRSSGNVGFDPFYGSCNTSGGYWIDQGSYDGLPGKSCGGGGVTDADGDGYDADSDCNDGDASIHPGTGEVCDDGIDQDCNGSDRASVTWYVDGDGDGYGAAATTVCGDQPAGTSATSGDCDDTRATVSPGTAELCDGLDNDCDGVIDDGPPTEMGAEIPALAARLVDMSAPRVLSPGDRGAVWAAFENVGAQPWPRGSLWLRPAATGEASPLLDETTWAAWDVLGVLQSDVPVGGTGIIEGSVRLDPEATGSVVETFTLTDTAGAPVRCPKGELSVDILMQADAPVIAVSRVAGSGCSTAPGRGWAWLLGLLGLLWRRRC